jgi:predicted MPP superfamily phosphohydrolase
MKHTVERQRFFNSKTGKHKAIVLKGIFILTSLAFLYSCSFGPYYKKSVKNWKDSIPPDSSNLTYSVFLIGDAGYPSLTKQEPTLKLLQNFLEKDSNSSVVFLGDNIYFDGMPAPNSNGREMAEKKLNEQLNILKNYKGETYFIAGNHDWEYMRQNGLARVKFQEEYIESYLNRGNVFVPDNGCPGPFSAKVYNNVILIAVDSQWWLHKYEKPYGRCGDCTAEDEHDMLVQLEDLIKTNRNKHIILVAHHPLMSNGNHGGYYNIIDYIFPLHIIHPKLYIPIPVLGSIYPLYRKFGGTDQDIAHYRYQEYKNEIIKIISSYDNIVYAAGHDHNLQYHETENLHHVISGSGSKITPVKGGDQALYTEKHNGFSILKYYQNGQAWIEYWIPEGDGSKGRLAFRHLVYTRKSGSPESYCSLSAIDYGDSTATIQATDKYQVNSFRRLFFGNHYRQEWITPIDAPLIDLKTEKGGLIPYGIGGRRQSISLKLRDLDDKEYVLRSINKDPTKAVPIDFRNTFIHDIVEDQISAQHPYAAVTVPTLEDAVGVYHTNPKIVLIPNDSCLGPYREQFKNMLALFEENPNENQETVKSFGYSKNIVGTDRMREKLESDNDNKVDERNFLRVRFLDMFIGDWDRHERQYRWAIFQKEKGEVYKAIPEDRDQAYFKFDGWLPYIAHRKWAIRNLQNFGDTYHDIVGLNLSAVNVDRRYLSSLTEEDWKEIADSMKIELTDEVIEKAIKKLPDTIYNLHGPEIISKLKRRRDELPTAVVIYYKALSRFVDIYGSDKNEKFVVERLNNFETKVSVFKVNKEGEIKDKLYERTFNRKITKELRLYGLAGEDDFEIKGKVKKGVKIRIIGGNDADTLNDISQVRGIQEKTVFYDSKSDNVIKKKNESDLRLSNLEVIHYPSQDKFFYTYKGPRLAIAFNQDDGLFLGGGFVYRNYKFRSSPYGSQHIFLFSRALNTGSTKFDYMGDIRNVIKGLDLGINFDAYTPAFVMNFFGYGNESKKDRSQPIEFYRIHLENIFFNPSLKKDITKFLTVGVGPKYSHYKLDHRPNSYLGETITDPSFYSPRDYLGLRAYFKLGTRDNFRNPTRGILLTGEVNQNWRLGKSESYQQYLSEFSFYITPNLPFQLTIASRLGGAMNFGAYEFYQANALGYTSGIGQAGNLRGYRKSRFIGDKSLYHNLDVRIQLFRFNAYIFTCKVGVLGLIDNGKVWVKNQTSHRWHTGYGGGVWIDIYNKFILTSTYSFSSDDSLYNLRMGFFF